MIIVLVKRSVRADKIEEFFASYNHDKPTHPDFIGEKLTKLNSSEELPEAMRSFHVETPGAVTFINVAQWKSAKSFIENFKPQTMHDPDIEAADRVRLVLDVIDV